jgi:hypothetical protein
MATKTEVIAPVTPMGKAFVLDMGSGRGYVVVMTECCDASTTYVEDVHVCKGCYEEVDYRYGWGFYLDEAVTDKNIEVVSMMFFDGDIDATKSFITECEFYWNAKAGA